MVRHVVWPLLHLRFSRAQPAPALVAGAAGAAPAEVAPEVGRAVPGLPARVAQHHGLGHAVAAPPEARAADVGLRAPRPVRAQPQRPVAVTVLLALAGRNTYIMFRFLVKTTLDKSALGIVTTAETLDMVNVY